mgnify:CR=1 FL=1
MRAAFCRADSCSGYPIKEFDVVPKESSVVISYMAIRKYDKEADEKISPHEASKRDDAMLSFTGKDDISAAHS